MRLPYVPNPPPTSTPEEAAIVKRVQERRAPRPLQPLDLALLHSPPVADGWNAFLGAVRTKTIIADDVRELAISRVAVVNEAWYEWGHHAPLAVKAGVAEAAMEGVKVSGAVTLAQRPEGLTEKQWASVVIADEMTRSVKVSDETFDKVKALFGERETVEIVATVACYNCVSRFLVALDGEKRPHSPLYKRQSRYADIVVKLVRGTVLDQMQRTNGMIFRIKQSRGQDNENVYAKLRASASSEIAHKVMWTEPVIYCSQLVNLKSKGIAPSRLCTLCSVPSLSKSENVCVMQVNQIQVSFPMN